MVNFSVTLTIKHCHKKKGDLKMKLTTEDLLPYSTGWVEIKKVGGYLIRGGIREIAILENNILKIKFIWKARFEGWPSKNPAFIMIPEFTDYIVDLDRCCVSIWSAKSDPKTVSLYLEPAEEEIKIHKANFDMPIPISDMIGFKIEMIAELEAIKESCLSKIDFNFIPKVDFNIDQIPDSPNSRGYLRMDFKWQGIKWYFIRISKGDDCSHSLIYYWLLDQIAEHFLVTSQDIQNLLVESGGGSITKTKEKELKLWGTAFLDREEDNRELTRQILGEELVCDVK